MGTIQSGTGLASGLDVKSIVDALINAQKGTVNRLTARVTDLQTQDAGLLKLSSAINDFKTVSSALTDKTVFNRTSYTASDTTQFGITLSSGATVGTYNVQALRKAATHQQASKGFADASQLVGSGSISIAKGGQVASRTKLDALNQGAGVDRCSIRITDRSGASTVIDLSAAINVDDVVDAINKNTDIAVSARVEGGHLVLADKTGQTSSNLIVTNVGTTQTASELGIAQNVSSNTLTGSDVYQVTGDFKLSQINDGLGVRIAPSTSTIRISLTDAGNSTVDVDLNGAVTVQDVVNKINNSSNNGGKVSAEVQNGRIVLHDLTGGGGSNPLQVTDLTGSSVVKQLGLNGTAVGDTLTGKSLGAGIDSVLLRNLKGGKGITQLGTLNLTDRTGTTASIDLSSAESLNDVIAAINNATSAGNVKLQLTATLNSSKTGIVITDTSGSTSSNLVISDAGGSTIAADLGITVNAAQTSVSSGSLSRQYVNESTALTSFTKNGALSTGSFSIKDSNGASYVVALTSATATVGDLIDKINTVTGGQVTAELNNTGDGFKLVDHAGGADQVEVAELGGTVADNLRIKGTGTTVGGHSELSARQTTVITVDGTDTWTTLTQKLNNANAGLTASILDTGTTINPLRLSLTSTTSGYAGELIVDDSGLNLGLTTTTQAQDAVIRVGSDTGGYVYSSGNNKFTQVGPGITLDLKNIGTQPTEIQIDSDSTQIAGALNTFATKFNALIATTNALTAYNADAQTSGPLLGDSIVQRSLDRISAVRNYVNPDSSSPIKTLVDLGFRVGDNGAITFDQDKFQAAWDANPTAVTRFLNDATSGLGKKLNSAVTNLTDQYTGVITLEDKSFQDSITTTQARITDLNTILDKRRETLNLQFTNMETILSHLQSQQSVLTQFAASWSANSGSSSSSK
ncbi:MAG: flagellar filament capping protein FliD [Planctomycetales bacterium]